MSDSPKIQSQLGAGPRTLLVIAGVMGLYVGSYLLLYDKQQTSYDPATGTSTRGRLKIGPSVRVPGDFTIYARRRSILDDIYHPLVLISDRLEAR